MHHHANFHADQKIHCGYIASFLFFIGSNMPIINPIWRTAAILDLLYAYWNHPQRALGGLYHRAKFGWN